MASSVFPTQSWTLTDTVEVCDLVFLLLVSSFVLLYALGRQENSSQKSQNFKSVETFEMTESSCSQARWATAGCQGPCLLGFEYIFPWMETQHPLGATCSSFLTTFTENYRRNLKCLFELLVLSLGSTEKSLPAFLLLSSLDFILVGMDLS